MILSHGANFIKLPEYERTRLNARLLDLRERIEIVKRFYNVALTGEALKLSEGKPIPGVMP